MIYPRSSSLVARFEHDDFYFQAWARPLLRSYSLFLMKGAKMAAHFNPVKSRLQNSAYSL